MYRIWFWIILLIATVIVAIFHTKVHRYNLANKNLIISSMYKDVRPYRLLWGILLLIFLFLFFCYKSIELPEIKYVDRIKLNTVDNHLEQSLGVEVCKPKSETKKFFCTEDERNEYGCDDHPTCEGCTGYICGILDTIISSGVVLPVSGTDKILTADGQQTSMEFEVYQGDEILAQKNRVLQTGIIIDNLPSKKAHEAGVDIIFNVDKKGYLSFKAVDIDNSNNVIEATIKIPNNGYEVVPEGRISMFEVIKWEIERLLNRL